MRLHDFTVTAHMEGDKEAFAIAGGPMHKDVQDLLAYLPAMNPVLGDWNSSSSIGLPTPPVKVTKQNIYGDEQWRKRVRESLKRHFDIKQRRPRATTGSVASSDRLVKDTKTIDEWRQAARQLIAVEMELAGVYRAARKKGKEYPILAVRGISDIVGFKRHSDWTAYACHTAAAFTYALLKTKPIEPRGDLARNNRPQSSDLQSPLNSRTPSSSSNINPFEYGLPVSPERFFGRFKQFEDIRNRFGSISAQCISIAGFRRNGKTSLLRYISQRPLEFCTEEQQPLIIFLDLQDRKFHTPTGILEGIKRHISSATGVTPWQNNDEDYEVVKGLKRTARDGCRLIILLDEFECIKRRLDVFKGWGEDWRAKVSDGLFVLGVASQRPLNEIYKTAGLVSSPFGNIFTETIVGAFEEDEWRNLVRRGFESGSRDLDTTDYDLIDSLAGGLPYYTQMAASLLWQHRDHRKVQTAFAQQTTSRFTELWESLTSGEQHALRYAAGIPNLAPPSASILTRLKLHGLLRSDGHLFSNAFVDYVRGL